MLSVLNPFVSMFGLLVGQRRIEADEQFVHAGLRHGARSQPGVELEDCGRLGPSCFAELLSFAPTGSLISLISLQIAASSDRAVLTDLASRCASDRALKELGITGHSGS